MVRSVLSCIGEALEPVRLDLFTPSEVQSLGWEYPLEKGMATPPVFLPGEFHEQRSLVGYRGCK